MPAPLRRARLVSGAAAVFALSACAPTPAPVPAGPPPASSTTSATAAPLTGAATIAARPSEPAPTSSSPSPVPVPAPASPAPRTQPGRVVVLDPGHNGGNAGAPAAINRQVPDGRGGTKACNTTGTSTNAGYAEHTFTFDVARRVEKRLVARGIRVVLTRPDDRGVGPCVDERGRAGEKADADAVVSIHADGAGPGDRGFHVAYSDPPLNDIQRGPARVLAADLRDGLAAAGFPRSSYIGRDGLSPRRDLAGLNLATRPTALIECANMRNAAEAALVTSESGRERYAGAIADGIVRFLDG